MIGNGVGVTQLLIAAKINVASLTFEGSGYSGNGVAADLFDVLDNKANHDVITHLQCFKLYKY